MAGYKNILCATDFSQNSQAAVERAAELAKLYGAKLTLFHVIEYFPEDRSNVLIAPENADPAAYREEQARASLNEIAGGLGAEDVEQVIHFSSNSAKHEILCYLKEQKFDLAVIASHGHHVITSILGSTANGVVQSSFCDVLVMRT